MREIGKMEQEAEGTKEEEQMKEEEGGKEDIRANDI